MSAPDVLASTSATSPGGPSGSPDPRRKITMVSILAGLATLVGMVAAAAQLIDFSTQGFTLIWQAVGLILVTAGLVFLVVLVVNLVARRDWTSIGLIVAIILAVAGGSALYAVARPTIVESCPTDSTDPDVLSGQRYVQPTSEGDIETDLTFCRVDINGGRPISGRYTLSGSVIGDVPEGHQLALLLQFDPSTCDANGNPGTGGYFLKHRFDLVGGEVVHWHLDDVITYTESASIRRRFVYALGSPDAIDEIQRHNDDYRNKDGYAGVLEVPPSIQHVASFPVHLGPVRDCPS